MSAHSGLRGRYEETCRIAAAHSVDPIVLREGWMQHRKSVRAHEGVRDRICVLGVPSISTGRYDRGQLVHRRQLRSAAHNSRWAQASWEESESSDSVRVGDVRKTGRELDAAMSSLFEQVQAEWGGAAKFDCFVEALRHELHVLSDRRLHTAYFHSIDLGGRSEGPTLVKMQTSR